MKVVIDKNAVPGLQRVSSLPDAAVVDHDGELWMLASASKRYTGAEYEALVHLEHGFILRVAPSLMVRRLERVKLVVEESRVSQPNRDSDCNCDMYAIDCPRFRFRTGLTEAEVKWQ